MTKRPQFLVNGGWWKLTPILNGDDDGPLEFNSNSATLRGRRVNEGAGRLPDPFRRQFLESAVTYTIYSYATPIAWLTQDGNWHTPPVRYSVTTSKHQGRVFPAISQINGV